MEQHLHQRDRDGRLSAVCDYERLCRRARGRGILSVLSHTEKIKVLMAQASSNGTLIHVCTCVRMHYRSCIQIVSFSWLHYIQARSFFLFAAPAFSTYNMWTSIHMHRLFPGCRAARVSHERGDALLPTPHPTYSPSYRITLLYKCSEVILSVDALPLPL